MLQMCDLTHTRTRARAHTHTHTHKITFLTENFRSPYTPSHLVYQCTWCPLH